MSYVNNPNGFNVKQDQSGFDAGSATVNTLAGELDVESGGEIDIESGAIIDVESGGEIDINSGATLDVNGTLDASGGVTKISGSGSPGIADSEIRYGSYSGSAGLFLSASGSTLFIAGTAI